MPSVRELMTARVTTVHRSTLLADLLTLLHEGEMRHLPVLDDRDRVMGVLSDRDLARMVRTTPAGWAPFELLDITAERAMTSPAVTVGPDEDAREAARRMFDRKIGCLPVVEGDHLVGILTEADFVAYVARG